MRSPSAAGEAEVARRQAREILAEGRFHAASVPRPLHGVLHAIGRALATPVHALDELVKDLGTVIPGGTTVVWAILAGLVLVVCATLARRGARLGLRSPATHRAGSAAIAPMSADDLERAALHAQRDGRNADAVRLRFRAGLMRLSERELVNVAPSMSNAQISRALRSARFDDLARRFEEIVYGNRPALEEDVQATRLEWPQLLGSRPG